MRKTILKRAKSSTAPTHYPFSDKFQPLFQPLRQCSIPEKIQEISRCCVTEQPYRKPDTGEGKLLIDRGLQTELGWQREQGWKVREGRGVHCSPLHCISRCWVMHDWISQTDWDTASCTADLAFRPCSPGTFSAPR